MPDMAEVYHIQWKGSVIGEEGGVEGGSGVVIWRFQGSKSQSREAPGV